MKTEKENTFSINFSAACYGMNSPFQEVFSVSWYLSVVPGLGNMSAPDLCSITLDEAFG
jgi:hypothetical protein